MKKLLMAVERVREIHKPKSTGRTEYVLDGRGGITGTAPTFTCPEGCMASVWFFEGQECDTYKALDEQGIKVERRPRSPWLPVEGESSDEA